MSRWARDITWPPHSALATDLNSVAKAVAGYHESLPMLEAQLAVEGCLGVVSMDISFLHAIEVDYGVAAYEEVRRRIFRIFEEQRGKDYRDGDVLALDQPGGVQMMLFLEHKRRRNVQLTSADLEAARKRLQRSLFKSMARATFPYLKSAPQIHAGYGLAIHNPLLSVKRAIDLALRDANELASHERSGNRLGSRRKILDLIAGGKIVTAYQPIQAMADRSEMAVEALSRGAPGTNLENAGLLFGSATRHDLLVELDRLCRSQALLRAQHIAEESRLFVNTLPATIRDPQFKDKPLIDFLGRAKVSPKRIVIEITEKLVIDNYGLFLETMAYFADLGMSFAVDDVGAGYSGLEAIANLKPSFLKIDMSLVRNVHESVVNREMCKAIVSLGRGIGAEIIAEGIETEDEFAALVDMNVDYGQGYLLARPQLAPEEE